jgi:vanillate O-demethylase monooxygenase subunit
MTYLRNAWYVACWSDEVKTSEMLSRTLLEEPVVFYRLTDGTPAALQDRCPEDPALIPDYGVLDENSGYKTSRGKIMIDANYELIAENLLDLSHAPFLHNGLLGSPEMVASLPVVREEGTMLHVDRWMANVSVPSLFDMLFRRDGQNVDAWQNMTWHPPGCFMLDAGVQALGESRENRGWMYGVHILTPETANTTHYHFAAARPPGSPEVDLETNKRLGEMRRIAFEDQDKPILNAQQAAIGDGDFWAMKPVLLNIDAGPIRMRRQLAKLIEQEVANRAEKLSETRRSVA